ncbi:phenylalanine--tRNA ligase subunit alpha [Staphylothermus hellenicus]|uniref:phenylalanine--tRNA ligase n=1 Tax=Staphylothermus hellenicus (strain DSM 12710 / JCM 10830 / BK20S6-10-b1 / P8) TaxID=591019 RepID=D7DBZ0_STAHD|nr:phenylalanine--tRNA ligase subunit alpha [Staphylothermus hellenicus]ADI31687.1 transcriptional regulator, MarR family [Staphylothermus hellenicus DSM 12710]
MSRGNNGKYYLPSRQYRIVEVLLNTGPLSVEELARALNEKPENIMRDLAELEAKGLLRVIRRIKQVPVITGEGREVLIKRTPEERVFRVMYRCAGKSVGDFLECVGSEAGIDKQKARIGFQYLVRNKCLSVMNGIVVVDDEYDCHRAIEDASIIRSALEKIMRGETIGKDIVNVLKRRRMVRIEKKTIIIVEPSKVLEKLFREGLIARRELLTVVTPKPRSELEKYIIKEFDLTIPPPKPVGGRLNAYIEFLDLVRDILVSMGFEEVKGPHVELEFWNFDALFQAQDHPAREIHDTFFLKTDFKGKVPEELLSRAGKIHEIGWGYKWDPIRSLRPILRSQTTAVSVRAIYERGEGEYRVFSLDRVFRPETLDAKHAMEFYQLDGIIVGKNVTFKHLLAFFKEFAAALGIREVWFKPGYFPFTEPSVEGFIKHPSLGWIEVFPGGVFRPEVMEILGAPGVRAIAWGIGIDRLAMAVLGLDDIRDLFSKDLDFLQKLPTPILPYFISKTQASDVRVVSAPK